MIYKENYNNVISQLKNYIEGAYVIPDCYYYTPTYNNQYDLIMNELEKEMYKNRCKIDYYNRIDKFIEQEPYKLFFQNHKTNKPSKNKISRYKLFGYDSKQIRMSNPEECYFVLFSTLNDNYESIINKPSCIQIPGHIFHRYVLKTILTNNKSYCLNVVYDYCMIHRPSHRQNYCDYSDHHGNVSMYYPYDKWRCTFYYDDELFEHYGNKKNEQSCEYKYDIKMNRQMKLKIKEKYFNEINFNNYCLYYKHSILPDVINSNILSFII